jgi:hypothetical protein
MDPTKEQLQILCKPQSAMETLAVIREAFGEESMNCLWKVQNNRLRKAIQAKRQIQEHARHFI